MLHGCRLFDGIGCNFGRVTTLVVCKRSCCCSCFFRFSHLGFLSLLGNISHPCFLSLLGLACLLLLLSFFLCHLPRPHQLGIGHTSRSPDKGRGQDDTEQQETQTEEAATVNEEGCKENLQSVVQRCAGGKDEIEHRLPCLERAATLHATSRDVEGNEQEHHAYDEMVRHDRRHHDISKREEEECQHRGIGASHLYDLTEDAVYEHHAVEGAEHLYGSHDEDGTVDAGELHQSLVDEIRHIHVERQQRVAVHVVACQPVAHDRIGDGVKARDVEVVYKQRPVPPCDGREEVIILAQHKGIQRQQGHQHNKG